MPESGNPHEDRNMRKNKQDSRRILIVDDSAMMRNALKTELKPLKIIITEASNGQEGLDLALDNRFDLIVTDVDMPLMNGVELCRKLKENATTRHIPVVMLSSFDSDTDIEKGFQVGASAYISKNEAKLNFSQTITNLLSEATIRQNQLILVVDDSTTILNIVETGLIQAGFQVLTAFNGSEALDLLKKDHPHLILSDINMPVMNGFQFCNEVHSDSNLASIPFVVMSSINDRGAMKRMLKYGAVAYITKPFNIDQLVILIEKLLSDHFLLLLKEKERLDMEHRLMLASITSLVSALEARDAYTRGHSESVAEILGGMLTLLGEPEESVERIIIGGKLHDIGKIGVRDSILLKPASLTKVEYRHIRQHPIIGARILEPIPSLSDIVTIVLYHHERIDGKGYPKGLKGNDIPLWARMAAVADTYNALTSKRPYRNAVTQEKALRIIDEAKGSQLCPFSVELLQKWLQSDQ